MTDEVPIRSGQWRLTAYVQELQQRGGIPMSATRPPAGEVVVVIHDVAYLVQLVPYETDTGWEQSITIEMPGGDLYDRVVALIERLYPVCAEVIRTQFHRVPRSLVDVAMRVQRDHLDALRADNIVFRRTDVASRGPAHQVGTPQEIAEVVERATTEEAIRNAIDNALLDDD
jgi:hypothetical protein